MPPSAHAGTAPAPIHYSALSPSKAIVLNGTASTPGAGASSIDEWVWTLKAKPTGSGANITGGSTATPTLESIDLPGTYLIWLRVRNNLNEWSAGLSAGDENGEFPDAWTTAPNSILVVEAKTEHLELVVKAEGEHNYWEKDEAAILALDRLRGDVGASAFPTAPRTRWVQAHDGDADADGSMAKPFNPVSAAANEYDGPWAQAVAALQAVDISDTPGAPRSIVAAGTLDDFSAASSTAYDEDVSITADGPWNIVFTGLAVFAAGRSFTYIASATPEAPPNLFIGGSGALGIASSVVYIPTISLRSDAASTWLIRWEGVAAGDVDVDTAVAASPLAFLRNCLFDTFVVPNLEIRSAVNTRFTSTLTVELINEALHCQFDDVTLTAVGGAVGGPAGFYSCLFDASGVFTAPAGAALFDPLTAENFETAGCSYSGGAGVDDHLNISGKRIRAKQELRTPAIYDNGGDGNLVVTTDGFFHLSSQLSAKMVAGAGGAQATIDMLQEFSSILQIFVAGENQRIWVGTADGDMLLFTNGAGRKTTLESHGGNTEVSAATLLDLIATGNWVLSGVVFTDDSGKVLGTKNDHGLDDTWINITGTSDGDGTYVAERIDDDTFYLKSYIDDSYIVWGSWSGADNTGDVYQAHVNLAGRSANVETDNDAVVNAGGRLVLKAGIGLIMYPASYLIAETTGGRIEFQVKGAAAQFIAKTEDGNVRLVAGGSGRKITHQGNDATHPGTVKHAEASQDPTTGTTKELLKSYEIEDGSFVNPGQRLFVTAIMQATLNANSKTFDLELDGQSLISYTDADGMTPIIRMEAEIICLGTANQVTYTRLWVGNTVTATSVVVTTIDMTAADKLVQVYGTSPSASGEVTAVALMVDEKPAVA